jgi:hypothetical protein
LSIRGQATEDERGECRYEIPITVMGPARHKVRTDGRASTLEEAKTQFAAAWTAFKVIQRDSDSGKP